MLFSLKNMRIFFKICFIFVLLPLFAEAEYDPVSVYLTWTKSPESSMTILWLSGKQETDNKVYYKAIDANEKPFLEVTATHKIVPHGWPYLIHQVEITGLDSATAYQFKITENGKLFKFKTMSQNLTTVKFVEGGDIYHDNIEVVENTNTQAAKANPDFAVIGGDIAYSADTKHGLFPEEFPRWLKWLISWKKTMVTQEGFLIPILPTIGNHETKGGYGGSPMDAPCFYAFFPLPGVQGFNVVDFGNYMSIILLDSGHTHPVSGKQTDWLFYTLQARENVPYKFAVYHVPAYPSSSKRSRKHSYEIGNKIRQHWVPLFDKFSLTAGFEHHDHDFKRTYPLKNGKKCEKGVVYMGDGAWGVAVPRMPKRCLPYIAQALPQTHFILVTLNDESVKYEAINGKGEIIDRYEQKK